jgi:dihydroneopterin aldolase
MPHDTSQSTDIAILGAGPAGCSAASWLSQLGFSVTLIDRAPAPCATLSALHFTQDWLLGAPGQTLAALGERYAAQTLALPRLTSRLNTQVTQIDWQAGRWTLHGSGATPIQARVLILATGLRPLRPAAYFATPHPRVLDALALTAQRDTLKPGRVLLLGGGDNAVENALFLHERGFDVTIWSRSEWRGQAGFIARLQATPAITQRAGRPLPTAVRADADGVEVDGERFDQVAVLLGYEPEPSAWELVSSAWQRAGVPAVQPPYGDEPRFAALGLLVAGDASGHQHPCVQTALADGVVAAKAAQRLLQAQAAPGKPAAAASNNRQVLHLNGLRFGANLGVLDFEREGPQPIQVDADIHLGPQMIVAHDADIGHVLDYRRVRQIIIDECTAVHTDLLEALLGKLCTRLMGLPGVVGVHIKVAKLEIFPDCQVAISAEVGSW